MYTKSVHSVRTRLPFVYYRTVVFFAPRLVLRWIKADHVDIRHVVPQPVWEACLTKYEWPPGTRILGSVKGDPVACANEGQVARVPVHLRVSGDLGVPASRPPNIPVWELGGGDLVVEVRHDVGSFVQVTHVISEGKVVHRLCRVAVREVPVGAAVWARHTVGVLVVGQLGCFAVVEENAIVYATIVPDKKQHTMCAQYVYVLFTQSATLLHSAYTYCTPRVAVVFSSHRSSVLSRCAATIFRTVS